MTDWEQLMNTPYRVPKEKKARKVLAPTRYDLRKLYYDARRVMFQRQYKAAWDAGEYYDNDFPNISTTRGHTRYIQDVLNYLGHNADQNKTTGTPMLNKDGTPQLDREGKIKYRYSGSTNGATDTVNDIMVPGYPKAFGWKIEVKNKDTMSSAQIKYQAKMQRVGVLHSVIRVGELDNFWDEYYKIMAL